MSETIRVLLADDHPLVCAGIRATLSTEPDLTLVGEATNGHDAQRLCRELQPDVLVLDLRMPGPSAMETVAYIRAHCPAVRVLVLTACDEDAYVHGLVAAGVSGYVLKDEAPEVLAQAIRSVVQGGAWFSRRLVAKLVNREPADLAVQPCLTSRERQLLGLTMQGWDNARIAATLHLGEQTVRNYLRGLYAKLGVRSRAEAMVWARDHGVGAQSPAQSTGIADI